MQTHAEDISILHFQPGSLHDQNHGCFQADALKSSSENLTPETEVTECGLAHRRRLMAPSHKHGSGGGRACQVACSEERVRLPCLLRGHDKF